MPYWAKPHTIGFEIPRMKKQNVRHEEWKFTTWIAECTIAS